VGCIPKKSCQALCAILLALHGGSALAQLAAFGVELSAAGQVLQLDYGEPVEVEPFPLSLDPAALATSPSRSVTCVVDRQARPGCKNAWRVAEPAVVSDDSALLFPELRDERRSRRLELDDINLEFDNGLTVGMQSYYQEVDKRRFDFGLRGKMGDVGVALTLTRPGVQLQTETGGVRLHLRVGTTSGKDTNMLLGVRKRF
jgi:hypothetical protein